jgi:hypothetical protein
MPAALFAAAIDALFADRHLALDAVYRASGAASGVPVYIVIRQPDRIGEFGEVGIPLTHVDASDSVGGWKARDIPWPGLITLGRFRSSTRGLAAKRRVVSISGGFAGRMALSVTTARQWANRGKCRAACCVVERAIGRYR